MCCSFFSFDFILAWLLCAFWTARALTANHEPVVKPTTITYVVTGDVPDAIVTYSTFPGGIPRDVLIDTKLPWRKDIRVTGTGNSGRLEVNAGAYNGTVSCTVLVDGVQRMTGSDVGPNADAVCSGF